jgi:carbohydrate kinase (thermoresistant glucokinase family)
MHIVLTGVSGSGKTAVGKELAKQLKIPFFDGDDYHSDSNKAKMAASIPLNDEDRTPWLETLAKLLKKHPSAILACSALKSSYRTKLKVSPDVVFIYLKGDYDLIRKRMEKRKGHFFNLSLLDSQFATLEEPIEGFVIDISQSIPEIVTKIRKLLKK